MRCMCGDTYCPSCGPAQGNYRCDRCGRWASDHWPEIGDEDEVLLDLDHLTVQLQLDSGGRVDLNACGAPCEDLTDLIELIDQLHDTGAITATVREKLLGDVAGARTICASCGEEGLRGDWPDEGRIVASATSHEPICDDCEERRAREMDIRAWERDRGVL